MIPSRSAVLAVCLALALATGVGAADKVDLSDPASYCPASRQRMDYALTLTTRAYDAVGHHDPRWDGDARKAIGALARSWFYLPRMNGDENDVGWDNGGAAMEKGCDDPLLIFARARAMAQFQAPVSEIAALDERAVKGFRKSKYPAVLVVSATLRWANDTARANPKDDAVLKQARRHAEEAIALLPRALDDPKLSRAAVVDLLQVIAITSGHVEGDRDVYLERVLPTFEASPHVAKTDIFAGKANAYFDAAVEARGSGFADTVSPDGWKQMAARIDSARDAANESLKLDPDNADAARVLDYIGRYRPSAPAARAAAHELAVKLDPDDPRLYHAHLVQLLPQWGGSTEAMVAYGRQVAADYKGNGLAALTLPEAHWMAAYWSADTPATAYFEASPQIFDEVKPIYEAYFKAPDASNFHKTRYAVIAAYCGHWTEADAMFKSLGDHRYRFAINNDEAKLDALVAEAARKAAEK